MVKSKAELLKDAADAAIASVGIIAQVMLAACAWHKPCVPGNVPSVTVRLLRCVESSDDEDDEDDLFAPCLGSL